MFIYYELLSCFLSVEPKFMHWGEVIAGVLDERAEVGLLSRNIRIQGVMDKTCPHTNENCDAFGFDTFGAHIRVGKNDLADTMTSHQRQ